MKRFVVLLIFCLMVLPSLSFSQKGSFGEIKQLQSPQNPAIGFMIHGGAGVIKKGALTPEKGKGYRDKLQEIRKEEKAKAASGEKKVSETATPTAELPYNKFGTVGAVALDRNGNLAAGTSTGGMTNKKYGRVGDSPIIGAGTYANNNTCGVSGTGWGEFFIRLSVARDISALMEYQAMTVQAAADRVIHQKLPKLGGDRGLSVMDKFGNMAISFNSEGMYRAYIGPDGKPVVEIYK